MTFQPLDLLRRQIAHAQRQRRWETTAGLFAFGVTVSALVCVITQSTIPWLWLFLGSVIGFVITMPVVVWMERNPPK